VEIAEAWVVANVDRAPARRLDEMPRRDARRATVRSLIRAVVGTTSLLLAYTFLPLSAATDKEVVVRLLIAAVLIPTVLWFQIRSISRAEFPQLRAADSLVVAATLMVVVFASVYLTMSRRDVDAFSETLERVSSMYFTVTTLATVGYGDITPRTESARIAAIIQMAFNVAFIGLAAKLITGTAKRRLDAPRTP
jgi:hypothetical protein